jgi:bcr-type benzoyl-CoA reductase subunit B
METKYQPIKLKCHEQLRRITARYWEQAQQVRETGKRVVWCSGMVPAEFLTAMDFFTIYCMNHSATCGARGVSLELCQRAESEGYSPDICSYSRTDIGSALAGEESKSPLNQPKPDLLLVGNGQCHTITKWFESLGWLFNVPVILIDVPFLHDDMDKETYSRARAYVKEQLQELIYFLEEFTGHSFDYDRLREDVANSSKMFQLWQEALEVRQNIPSPVTVFDIFTHLFPILGLRGTAEGADYYQEFKEELAERVANKVSAIPGERFRLHLDGVPIWFNLKGLASKFASHGAAPLSHVYTMSFGRFSNLDPASPIDSTAECLLTPHSNRGTKQRIDILVDHVEKYHLNGLAMQISRTCKGLNVGVYDIMEGVERRTGIPGVVFETDMCDPRLHSEAQVDATLEDFFEMLAARYPSGSSSAR